MPPTKRAQAPRTPPAETVRRDAATRSGRTAGVRTEPPTTGRQAAREQMVLRIRTVAHAHLARDGASGLSMRAVAREVGVVSSAIYRYVPSRDALLHLLVADALDSLSAAVAEAEAAVRRSDLKGRFAAVGRAQRAWALASPAQHSLIASRPVPGLAPRPAPDGAAGVLGAVPTLLLHIVDEAAAKNGTKNGAKAGAKTTGDAAPRLPPAVRRDLAAIRRSTGLAASEDAVARGLLAWAGLAGAVSLEVSGQLAELSDSPDAWFAHEVERLARLAGIS